MPPRSSLLPSLRRAANRGAGPRGKAASPRVQAAADAGILTRSNTRPGSAGRRAADAATYRARAAQVRPGHTIREALGHERAGLPERGMSAILVGSGYVTLEGLNGSDVRRTARYSSLVGELVSGELSPQAFRRRVGSWREIRGERFESDPDVVMAIIETRRALGEEIFEYLGRRT